MASGALFDCLFIIITENEYEYEYEFAMQLLSKLTTKIDTFWLSCV